MKCLIIGCLIVCASLFAGLSDGTGADRQSERSAYQGELDRLKKEKPQEYESTRKGLVFMRKLTLGALGYAVGPLDGDQNEASTRALRAYQKKNNLPETGDPLSFDTFKQLETDQKIIDYHPISLPMLHVFTDFWDDGFVAGSGTWILPNEKMGVPEQTSKINCDKKTKTCTEATALVTGDGGNRRLSVDIETYEIERWDDHGLVTKPRETGFGCARYVRRINRKQKSITGIRSTIADDGVCKGVENRELYMSLTDGFKVYLDLSNTRNEAWRQLLNVSPAVLRGMFSTDNVQPQK